MRVNDVMRPGPPSVTPLTPARDAAALLERRAVSALPVVDAGGRLRGVVTDVQLLSGAEVVGDDYSHTALSVSDVDDVLDAIEVMAVTSVSDLPVLDRQGVVVGQISREDVARALSRRDTDIELEVTQRFAEMGLPTATAAVRDGVVTIGEVGPDRDRALARVAALTVPGVRDIVWTQ